MDNLIRDQESFLAWAHSTQILIKEKQASRTKSSDYSAQATPNA